MSSVMQINRAIVRLGNAIPEPVARRLTSTSVGSKLLRPVINRYMPQKPVPVVVRSGPAQGLRLLIDPRCEKFYWTGTHERHVQDAIARLLRPGMVFWDVGAHIGFFSILASRLVGRSGHVRAFEPFPPTRDRLVASIALNDAKNIIVDTCALAATAGQSVLYVHSRTLTSSLVRQDGDRTPLNVQCRTLDDIAKTAPPPHLLKIDAEGADLEVLQGGLRLIADHRPIIIAEINSIDLQSAAQRLLPEYRFDQLDSRNWLLHQPA